MSQLINVKQLNDALNSEGLIILDCRSDLTNRNAGKEQYQKSHIPGAQFAHLEEDLSSDIVANETGRHPLPHKSDFESTIRKWGIQQQSTVVVYDQSNSMYAARAWWLLKWAGIDDVKVLNGGYQQWLDLDYPTQTKTQELKPSDFNAAFKDDWTVDASALLELDKNTQLLDARALPRYKGELEPLDAKAGHIPGAINADFTKNLEANGTFKPVSSLSERFTSMRNKDVICYCGSGVTACHNILAMTEAGLPMPKLYPGSWSEWITDDSRPINHGTEGELN